MSTNDRIIELNAAAKPLTKVVEKKFDYDASYVETLLPEGITVESLKAHQKAESDILAATLHTSGLAGADAMKADETIEEITGKLTIGSTNHKILQVRTASYPNPRRFEEGQPQRFEFFGEITARSNPAGGTAIKASRDAVRAYAADIFG